MADTNNKNILNNDQLEKAAGGNDISVPIQRFKPGDKVLLRIYPQYGVGTVVAVQLVEGNYGPYWECQVEFASGVMTADQAEFIESSYQS